MRCLACESVMKPEEIIWIADKGKHEELCRYCRAVVYAALSDRDLDTVVKEIPVEIDEDNEEFDDYG